MQITKREIEGSWNSKVRGRRNERGKEIHRAKVSVGKKEGRVGRLRTRERERVKWERRRVVYR